MPDYNAPQPQSHAISRVIAREEALERKRPTATPPVVLPAMQFSYAGALQAAIESPPWYPEVAVVVVQVRVSLLAAATADHVIEVRVDGSAVAQYTLPSGEATAVTTASIPVLPGSFVTVKTITVTDSDLAVSLRVKAR